MNCDKAREILNALMDGHAHSREAAARQHLTVCAGCREWHAGMLEVFRTLDAARDDIPDVDVASAVMARLPEAHPASRRAPGRSYPRLILAWIGASWLVGLLIVAALGLAVSAWLGSGYADRIVLSAVEATKAASGVLAVAGRNVLSLIDVMSRLATDLRPTILSFLVLDALFLLAVFMVLFGRRRAVRTSVIFC